MISDPAKLQTSSEYQRNLTGQITEKKLSKILQTDSIFF